MSRVLNWDITVPYQWTAGPVYGRFLEGLRQKKFWGLKCPSCSKIYFPPSDICSPCHTDLSAGEWMELEQEGEVISWSRVERNFFGERPAEDYVAGRIKPTDYSEHPLLWPPEPPFALVLVKIKGSDTSFLHLVREEKDLKKLEVGAKVAPAWKDEGEGYLLDLEGFKVL